jgi:drug/metabolite transporter (DMT)-like permease
LLEQLVAFADRARVIAALQALMVCFLWSTSFIITKRLYRDGIGPLTLTGLRYGLAGLALLPLWAWRRRTSPSRPRPRPPHPRLWILGALGLAGYAINPLGYTIGLTVLPASWVGVVLGVNNTLQVLLWSALVLRERPTTIQLAAIVVATLASVAFQTPDAQLRSSVLAPTLAMLISGTGYALWIVGNRSLLHKTDPLELVCPSMLSGALPVLAIAIAIEGLPHLPASAWLLMLRLAIINTSAAFLTWTHTQRSLAPHESAAINNTMTVQVALLAFLLLHEPLSARQWVLILVVAGATLIVQTTGKAPARIDLTRR